MFKKLLIVALIAGGAVAVLKGTKFFGYAKQEVMSWKESWEESLPVEKKIALLRKEVAALDKDINNVKDELAKEIVLTQRLQKDMAEKHTAVNTDRKRVDAFAAQIQEKETTGTPVSVGSAKFSISEAKARLKQDVDTHILRKKNLASIEQAYNHHEKIKDTLTRTLDELSRQKDALTIEIDSVEAEFKTLQLTQIESKYQRDDSRLSKIKQDLAKLRDSVKIQEVRASLDAPTKALETPVTTTPTTPESVEDILAPLNGKNDKIEKSGE
jgi:chromosome segregation ATPase